MYLSSSVRKKSTDFVSQTSRSHQMSTGSTLTSWPSYYFTWCHSSSSLPPTSQLPVGCGATMPSATPQLLSTPPREESVGEPWPCCSWWSGCSLFAGSHSIATWCCCPARPSSPLTSFTSAFTGWLWAPLATILSSTAVWIPPSARSWGSSLTCAGGNRGLQSAWRKSFVPWLLVTGSPGLTITSPQVQGRLCPTRATPGHNVVMPLPVSPTILKIHMSFLLAGRSSWGDLKSSQWSPSWLWAEWKQLPQCDRILVCESLNPVLGSHLVPKNTGNPKISQMYGLALRRKSVAAEQEMGFVLTLTEETVIIKWYPCGVIQPFLFPHLFFQSLFF